MIQVYNLSHYSSQISMVGSFILISRLTNSSSDTNRDIASSVMICGGVAGMKGLFARLSREISVMSKGVG